MRFNRHSSRSTHTGGVSQLADELRRQPFGSVVVLVGEPGHRLQLAQALAKELGYRTNLGAVVSPAIAATENNLDGIFSIANSPGSLLFFDEADALFGSRTEVKDSHDRYANLLSRISSFQGLVVIGAGSSHNVPTHLLPNYKTISVSEHWPPR